MADTHPLGMRPLGLFHFARRCCLLSRFLRCCFFLRGGSYLGLGGCLLSRFLRSCFFLCGGSYLRLGGCLLSCFLRSCFLCGGGYLRLGGCLLSRFLWGCFFSGHRLHSITGFAARYWRSVVIRTQHIHIPPSKGRTSHSLECPNLVIWQ